MAGLDSPSAFCYKKIFQSFSPSPSAQGKKGAVDTKPVFLCSENINEKSIPEDKGAAQLPGHGRCLCRAAGQTHARGRANTETQNPLRIIKVCEAMHRKPR